MSLRGSVACFNPKDEAEMVTARFGAWNLRRPGSFGCLVLWGSLLLRRKADSPEAIRLGGSPQQVSESFVPQH